MIPKRIFYMWIGSNKPIDVNACILSWKLNLPEYELIEINENNNKYFDFVKERQNNAFFDFVYKNQMWAYVADYARFCVLEKFGGIWLDTDVQVIKDFGKILTNDVFLGGETEEADHAETAVIGAVAHHPLIKDIRNFYETEIWESPLYTSPRIVTHCLQNYGWNGKTKDAGNMHISHNIVIYSPEYFYPLFSSAKFNFDMLSNKTVCIHWWKSSWRRTDVIEWLKSKHKIGKDKAISQKLLPYKRLYLFGCLRIGKYYLNSKTIKLLGMPIIKIIQTSRKTVAKLFGIIPLIKWR